MYKGKLNKQPTCYSLIKYVYMCQMGWLAKNKFDSFINVLSNYFRKMNGMFPKWRVVDFNRGFVCYYYPPYVSKVVEANKNFTMHTKFPFIFKY